LHYEFFHVRLPPPPPQKKIKFLSHHIFEFVNSVLYL